MPRRVYPDLSAYFSDNDDERLTHVAVELDCSPAYLSMIKSGDRQPALPLALRIAKRCNVPLESLIRADLRHAESWH